MTSINVNQDKASLFKKVSNVMEKVKHVPKNGYNSFHKYQYVQESDLVDHVRKFLVEEGLVLFPSLREYEIVGDTAICLFDMTLCDTETGETITSIQPAEGQDKGDKKFYKASTGALKYYLMKTFLVPSGDDPEADTTTDENAYKKQANTKAPATQKKTAASTKKVTKEQLDLINQRLDELTEITGRDNEAFIDSLKERVGDFKELKQMTSIQGSRCIENLTKWKSSYQSKLQ